MNDAATEAPPARRAPHPCARCSARRAVVARPKDGARLCRDCFCAAFEDDVHATITAHGVFARGERVAVAASGGKDSIVLAHVLSTLNARHDYGLDLFLLSIDEGIAGYRDDSLATVRQNSGAYALPLLVVSYKELYGWSMDEVVRASGLRNNCTFCGVFRRQALDRGAVHARADKIVTGHNADDIAETVLMNLLRGDIARLGRCTAIITGAAAPPAREQPASDSPPSAAGCISSRGCCGAGAACSMEHASEGSASLRDRLCSGCGGGENSCAAQVGRGSRCNCSPAVSSAVAHECGPQLLPTSCSCSPSLLHDATGSSSSGLGARRPPTQPFRAVPRAKPLKYCYEKEIVLYAYHKRLLYHATECSYSPQAYRGFARELVKDLEAVRPSVILDIVASAEAWQTDGGAAGGGGPSDELDEGDEDGGGRGSGGCGAPPGRFVPWAAGARAGTSDHHSDAGSVRSTSTSRTMASTQSLATRARVRSACARCGYMTSAGAASGGLLADRSLCQACSLLAGLEAGTPRVGLVSGRQVRRLVERHARERGAAAWVVAVDASGLPSLAAVGSAAAAAASSATALPVSAATGAAPA